MKPKSCCSRSNIPLAILLGAATAMTFLLGCGNGTTSSLPAMSGTGTTSGTMSGTVTTSISDPPVCAWAFDSVYVTITKVTAHLSDSAGPPTAGASTLVNLSTPMQIDLLHLKSPGMCVLSQSLGSTSGLTRVRSQPVRDSGQFFKQHVSAHEGCRSGGSDLRTPLRTRTSIVARPA